MSHAPTATSICATISAIAAIGGFALAGAELRADEAPIDGFIQRVVAQTTRSGLAIRAIREMRAGTVSGKHRGWMTVQTSVTPAGAFSWDVVSEGGSDRTREKVLLAVLNTEAASWRTGGHDGAALTPENYTFTRLAATGPAGQVQIQLTPRRSDTRLVNGVLTVNEDGYPISLEGVLAKSPSFWVKSVRVVKRYGRFAGVALPTVVESHADLKLFGKSTFTMRYQYVEVNGHRFPDAGLKAELTP
jgi:hypothetical protein